jgi:hypothetical protein
MQNGTGRFCVFCGKPMASTSAPLSLSLGSVMVAIVIIVLVAAIAALATRLSDGADADRVSHPLAVEGPIPDVVVAPAQTPACPEDMDPILWAEYDAGSYLLCAYYDEVRVVYRDSVRPDWVPNGVEFEDDYTTLKFSNGSAAILLYEGGFVSHLGAEHSDTSVASTFWTAGYEKRTYANAPGGMEACPESSFPLYFVAWEQGWQLTCGMAADQPTMFAYSDHEFGRDDSNKVERTVNGEYCAEFDETRVCTSVENEETSFTEDESTWIRDTEESYFPE